MTPVPTEDPIALLLPDLDGPARERVESLTRAMRLLAADAADSGSPTVGVQLGAARAALRDHCASSGAAALERLVACAALRCVTADSFLYFSVGAGRDVSREDAGRRGDEAEVGAACSSEAWAAAWDRATALLSPRVRSRIGLRVPEPGTSAGETLSLLIDALEAFARTAHYGGSDPSADLGRVELWRARQLAVSGPAAALEAEARLERLLARLGRCGEGARRSASSAQGSGHGRGSARSGGSGDAPGRSLRREALADLIAVLLGRGAPARAEEASRRAGPTASCAADCASPLDGLALMARWLVPAGTVGAVKAVPDFPRLARWSRGLGRPLPTAWSQLDRALGAGKRSDRGGPLSEAAPAPSSESAGGGAAASGDRRQGAGAQLRVEADVASRSSVAARALVVLRLRDGGHLEVTHADVAPACRSELTGWARARRYAFVEQGTPEHDAARSTLALTWLDVSRDPSHLTTLDRCTLGAGERARGLPAPRALTVDPIVDGEGELQGFLWIELDHRLIPTLAQRRELVTAWSSRLGHGPSGVRPVDVHLQPRGACAPRGTAADSFDDSASLELERAWGRVMERLQLKTAERRWVAFHASCAEDGDRSLHVVAEGGDGAERLGRPRLEGAWAPRRALSTGGAVRYDGQAGGLTLHPGASSGAAIPIRGRSGVIGVVTLESVRRRDAREGDVERWQSVLQSAAVELECAQVDALDRHRFGGGFALSPVDPDVAVDVARLGVLAGSSGDVAFVGPSGSGRRTAARWVHLASQASSGAPARAARFTASNAPHPAPLPTRRLRILPSFGLERDAIDRAFTDVEVGTVLLCDVDWLSLGAQEVVAQWLARPRHERPRVLATHEDPVAARRSSNHGDDQRRPAADVDAHPQRLHPELRRALGRLRFDARPLREARHRIPALSRYLVERLAAGEGRRPPELDDAAVALLWRQEWPEHIAGLEGALHRALLAGADASVDVECLGEALLEAGVSIVQRRPSRDPSLDDLASAAWATRTATGRVNKTRAALYMGWDPNTVASHLRETGLDDLEAVRERLGRRRDPTVVE